MTRVTFQEKAVAETQTLTFDFSSRLTLGESISSASTVAAVYSGTDSSPAAIISGGSSVSSPRVTQKVTGGLVGVVYDVTCTVTTSVGQVLTLSGYVTVR